MPRKRTCKTCMDTPCPIQREVRAFLGSWARERKRQMPKDHHILGKDVPDKAKMAEVLPEIGKAACSCPCHEID